jgi:hypothetical protein
VLTKAAPAPVPDNDRELAEGERHRRAPDPIRLARTSWWPPPPSGASSAPGWPVSTRRWWPPASARAGRGSRSGSRRPAVPPPISGRCRRGAASLRRAGRGGAGRGRQRAPVAPGLPARPASALPGRQHLRGLAPPRPAGAQLRVRRSRPARAADGRRLRAGGQHPALMAGTRPPAQQRCRAHPATRSKPGAAAAAPRSSGRRSPPVRPRRSGPASPARLEGDGRRTGKVSSRQSGSRGCRRRPVLTVHGKKGRR